MAQNDVQNLYFCKRMRHLWHYIRLNSYILLAPRMTFRHDMLFRDVRGNDESVFMYRLQNSRGLSENRRDKAVLAKLFRTLLYMN